VTLPPGFRLDHRAITASTNLDASIAAREGAEAGLVVLADEQTAGRGRQGRTWIAPPGCGLLVSVLRRPPVEARQAWRWTFLAALAVLDAVLDRGIWLKWPNDLYLGEAKLGGVLCELETVGTRVDSLVVGMGLNLRTPPGGWPEDLATPAAALDDDRHRLPLLADWLTALAAWEERLLAGEDVLPAVRDAMAPMIGLTVRVDGAPARVAGLGDSGALVVVDDAGRREVVAGDVHLGAPGREQGAP
jgi:BirA family biotin operon repressor/biotin-[acetyl-CoA-carboxylase] ligase